MFKPGTISHYKGKVSISEIQGLDKSGQGFYGVDYMKCPNLLLIYILTFIIHEAPAEFLEGSPVAHGPERAVKLVVGYHQILRVTSHVDHLEEGNSTRCKQEV